MTSNNNNHNNSSAPVFILITQRDIHTIAIAAGVVFVICILAGFECGLALREVL